MKLRFIFTGKNKWWLGGTGLFTTTGAYVLNQKTNFLESISHIVDTSVLHVVRNQVIAPIDLGVKNMRIKTKHAFDGLGDWIGDLEINKIDLGLEKNESILSTIYEGGKEIFDAIKNLIKEFVSFLVEKFVPYVQDNSVGDTYELLRSYIDPINHAFSRPNTERLQSAKNRLQQYLNAFKTPEFWKSLPTMHMFYMEFKDQIATLTEDQLAEVIDIYLDDPAEMYKKVELVMEAMKEDKDLKAKFRSDLMMDFVRGENIDVMKAKLTAAKVSSGLNSVFEFFGVAKTEEDTEESKGKIDPKEVENKITEMFAGIARLFA